MKMFKTVYAGIGIILTISVIATGDYGLSEINQEIYDTAVELQDKMNENGFVGFGVEDKKVRFFDGSVDYVVFGGEVEKEEAAFDTFVGTTSKIEGEYQVILPTYENFSDMFSLLGAVQSVAEGDMQFSEGDYNTNAHAATLWHEAFHAWQFTNWEEEIMTQAAEAGMKEDNLQEIIVNDIDSKDELVVSFSEEMDLLMNALEAEDVEEKKVLVAKALEIASTRKKQLSQKAAYAEQYYEMLEGTARYVEAKAYHLLEGDEAWSQMYLKDFVYSNGTGKYYEMGMYKCLLLDQLTPRWKEDFTVVVSLDEYLYQAITQ